MHLYHHITVGYISLNSAVRKNHVYNIKFWLMLHRETNFNLHKSIQNKYCKLMFHVFFLASLSLGLSTRWWRSLSCTQDMPLTLIYSLPKTSTKGAMDHWAKKLNAEMYIQQHYPSLADILRRKKVKQIQFECLAKGKHSEKNKMKFCPTLQDQRYLVTASNLPYRLLKHS